MKFINKWNLPLAILMTTMILTMLAVVVLFVLRLTGLSNLDVIVAVVTIWYFALWIYSLLTKKSFRDGAEVDYESAANSDDGWE